MNSAIARLERELVDLVAKKARLQKKIDKTLKDIETLKQRNNNGTKD